MSIRTTRLNSVPYGLPYKYPYLGRSHTVHTVPHMLLHKHRTHTNTKHTTYNKHTNHKCSQRPRTHEYSNTPCRHISKLAQTNHTTYHVTNTCNMPPQNTTFRRYPICGECFRHSKIHVTNTCNTGGAAEATTHRAHGSTYRVDACAKGWWLLSVAVMLAAHF